MAVLILCLYLIAAAPVERPKFFSVWTAFVKWVTTTRLWRASTLGLPTINLGLLQARFQMEVSFWHFSPWFRDRFSSERTEMQECLEHRLMYLPRWCHSSLMMSLFTTVITLLLLREVFGTQRMSAEGIQLLNLQGEVEFKCSSNTSWVLYFSRKDCNCMI